MHVDEQKKKLTGYSNPSILNLISHKRGHFLLIVFIVENN